MNKKKCSHSKISFVHLGEQMVFARRPHLSNVCLINQRFCPVPCLSGAVFSARRTVISSLCDD